MSIFNGKKFILGELVDQDSFEFGQKDFLLKTNGPPPSKPGVTQVVTPPAAAPVVTAPAQPDPNNPSSPTGSSATTGMTDAKKLIDKAVQKVDIYQTALDELSSGEISNETLERFKLITPAGMARAQLNQGYLIKQLESANAQLQSYTQLYGNNSQLQSAVETAKAQIEQAKASIEAAKQQILAAKEQAGATRYGADVQAYTKLLEMQLSPYATEAQGQINYFFDRMRVTEDPAQEKAAAILDTKLMSTLGSAGLIPSATYTYTDPATKETKSIKINKNTDIEVGKLGFVRENQDAGVLSEFSYYYIPKSFSDQHQLSQGVYNINEENNAIRVKKIVGKDGAISYQTLEEDKCTGKFKLGQVLTCEELRSSGNVYAKVDLVKHPVLSNGKKLENFFIDADEANNMYFNQAQANKSQQMYGYLNGIVKNDFMRRELSELISGWGQMNILEIIIRAVALFKGGKSLGIGGKGGKEGSLVKAEDGGGLGSEVEAMKALQGNSMLSSIAATLTGKGAALNGMSLDTFNEQLDMVKDAMRKAGTSEKDINKFISKASDNFISETEKQKEKQAQQQAEEQGFFSKLKSFLLPSTDRVLGKKGKVLDEIGTKEDVDAAQLIKGITPELAEKLGLDLSKLNGVDIADVKATQGQDGSYTIGLYDKNKKLKEDFVTK